MKIIDIQRIEELYKTLNPQLDMTNIIMIEDESLARLLNHFLFLQQYAEKIIANSSYTYEDVLYSQYYWFVGFKNHCSIVGYDGEMEQQAFFLIENLCNELDGNVDWALLEEIDTQGDLK